MAEESPKITEPEIVPGTFCTFIDVQVGEDFVRLTGCDEVRIAGYDGPELRITVRMVMPRATARQLLATLRRALAGHAER